MGQVENGRLPLVSVNASGVAGFTGSGSGQVHLARSGWIVIGTTKDAFFSLDRLATFLRASPLDLTVALNLDGGPVACQGIQLNGFERKTFGNWEMRTDDDDAPLLLTLPGVPAALRIVIAVFPN